MPTYNSAQAQIPIASSGQAGIEAQAIGGARPAADSVATPKKTMNAASDQGSRS